MENEFFIRRICVIAHLTQARYMKTCAEKRIIMKEDIKKFWQDEDGMGVVEIVLIIVVLIGLVIIFKSQITALVNKLLSKMSSQANQI